MATSRQIVQSGTSGPLSFASEQVALDSFQNIITQETVFGENFRLALEYLDYAQAKGWEKLEDEVIAYVRIVEDEETARIIGDPTAVPGIAEFFTPVAQQPVASPDSSSASASRTFTLQEIETTISTQLKESLDYVRAGLQGLVGTKTSGFTADNLKDFQVNVRVRISLYRLTESVLTNGVLKAADLKAKRIRPTTSSDPATGKDISLFDVVLKRNDGSRDESFPKPGYQSFAPAIERPNDGDYHFNTIANAARKGRKPALKIFQDFRDEFQKEIPGIFSDAENTTPTGIEALIQKISTELRLAFLTQIVALPAVRGIFEGRASRTAMFLCTGASNLDYRRQKTGPDVQEMRIEASLEPKAITHVLLPASMQGFSALLKQLRPNVTFIFVANTPTPIQVGYYDFGSQVQTSVKIIVPDYQAAIENLYAQGFTKMLTHIAKVD